MQDPIISTIRHAYIDCSEKNDAYFGGGGAAPGLLLNDRQHQTDGTTANERELSPNDP